jgi:hypothetical protein
MGETRKIAAILVADVVGYSRLVGGDEDRTLGRLRALRSDMIDPAIAVHRGRVVKRTGDGAIVEFRSVIDAVRCAVEVQSGMVERMPVFLPSAASNFVSAFISAMLSRKAMAISWATASISPRVWKVSARLAGFAYRRMPIGRFATSSTNSSSTSGSRFSRTSRGQCAPTR